MPPANNSKLTPTQRRERKRQHDREAQRVAREKTRQHIAHLEGLVKTLQDTESSSDRIQKLLDQLSSSQDEIGRLRDTLSRINRISQDNSQIYQRRPDPFRPYNDERSKKGDEASLCSTIGMPTGQDIPFVETDPACTLSDLENLLSIPPESASATSQEPFPLEALNLDAHPIDLDSLTLIREDSDPESCQSASKISPIPAGLCLDHLQHQNDSFNQLIQRDCDHEQQGTGPNDDSVLQVASFLMSIKDLEGRLWWLASRVLNHILSLKDVIFTPRVLDDDIAIRSCIDGWSAVEHMYKLDVGWKWLRVLDENMYSQLKITTRMAILRAMRTQYLAQQPGYKQSSAISLPDFMVPRPAQKHVVHDPLVEHFVWPGLREDLLFSPQKCTTNRFIDLFRNSAELLWAKDEHEAYVQDFDKGLYAFSAPFLGAYSQLECWRMKRDFLQEFPELRRAIPCSQPSLLGLRLPVITLDSFTEEEAENTNLLW